MSDPEQIGEPAAPPDQEPPQGARRRAGGLRRAFGCLARGMAVFLATAFICWAGWAVWLRSRPTPPPVDLELFDGVRYIRTIRRSPRPLIVHLVKVRADAPGIGFLVTAGDPSKELPLTGKLTTAFLKENRLQIAINADFFEPWWSRAPWDYYPHVGDPVQVKGFAASRGTVYASGPSRARSYTLAMTADNRLSLGPPPRQGTFNAVSGRPMLVRGGKREDLRDESRALHPRTGIGLSRDRQTLLLLLVDGRQPGYSEGATMTEFADLFLEYGAWEAVNLDGGGSTTLAAEDSDGKPKILNSPIDNYIPGRERPVANHLGVYARRKVAGPR